MITLNALKENIIKLVFGALYRADKVKLLNTGNNRKRLILLTNKVAIDYLIEDKEYRVSFDADAPAFIMYRDKSLLKALYKGFKRIG